MKQDQVVNKEFDFQKLADTQPEVTVAEAAVEAFADLGIQLAFGIPGGPIANLFYNLQNSKRIRTVLSQHEGGGAFAAMGWSMMAGGEQMALCFGTAGPGITNLITGIYAAFEERVPMFVLTANVSTTVRGKGAVQDSSPDSVGADLVSMLESVTAASVYCDDPNAVVSTIKSLHDIALATKRPVHLNIPANIAKMVHEPKTLSSMKIERNIPSSPLSTTSDVLKSVKSFLSAKKPLVFAGNGIKLSKTKDLLKAFSEKNRVPVIVTSHAKSILGADSESFVGEYGIATEPDAADFFEDYQPDSILVLGSRLAECSSSAWSPVFGRSKELIHVDIDASIFNRSYEATTVIVQDLKSFLELANQVQVSSDRTPYRNKKVCAPKEFKPSLSSPVHPKKLVHILSKTLPSDAVIFSDIGNSMLWLIKELTLKSEQDFFVPMSLGSMGSGIGCAIGAQTFSQSRPVVCITGDCSMQMHGAEVFTAKQEGLPLKWIVLNDGGHGTIDHGYRGLGLPVHSRFDTPIDFVKWADSYGIHSDRIDSCSENSFETVNSFLQLNEPALLEVRIDPEIAPPLNLRIKGLNSAPGLSSDA